ncbi:MAG: hypothetical protein K8G79_12610 [bacterium]|uniref:Release factor glutamine methyltransferase N-terminal domain-containing protein n=1 Tax=Candidatus Methylomirabilis tolerans TaxID=3123416 RepID=A0AAJ1AJK0_9BACT|nr:hypothetical protein [Candidatus Methylomirabilis sp.]
MGYAVVTAPSDSAKADYTYRRTVERLADNGVESAMLDAACLMEAASGIPRWRFILDPEQSIPSDRSRILESMLSRRLAREPLAYILGVKEFWSLPLVVSSDVLIPRPDTETLVEAVLDKISSRFKVQGSKFGGWTPSILHPAPCTYYCGPWYRQWRDCSGAGGRGAPCAHLRHRSFAGSLPDCQAEH